MNTPSKNDALLVEPEHGEIESSVQKKGDLRSGVNSLKSPRQNAAILHVHDWEEFLTPEGLRRKAGHSDAQFVALKELVDNGMEYGARTEHPEPGIVIVRDDGPGLDAAQIKDLYSVKRPMTSSKRWRKATRGMLGNGLRVFAGAAFVYGWKVEIESKGHTWQLHFRDNGMTELEDLGQSQATGTVVRVDYRNKDFIEDYREQIDLLGLCPGSIYGGPSVAAWYSPKDFKSLCHMAERMRVRAFILEFGLKPKSTLPAPPDARLSDADPGKLHAWILIQQKRLPKVVLPPMALEFPGYQYEVKSSYVEDGGAKYPATVEAWVRCTKDKGADSSFEQLWMNRTLALCEYELSRNTMFVGEICTEIKASKNAAYSVKLAITAAHYPMTSDGKNPSLDRFKDLVCGVVGRAARRAHQFAENPKYVEPVRKNSQIDAVFSVMEEAYVQASSNGKFTATARQVFYQVRPRVQLFGVKDLNDDYFTQTLLPRYREENDTAHWNTINYDARGRFVEPHGGEVVDLDTVNTKNYLDGNPARENYAAVLYIEKVQFADLLREAGVLDEFDLGLVEAKGQPTMAERAMLEYAAREKLPVFTLTDLDASGLVIHQTISDGSAKRGTDPVPAIRIGIDLETVNALGIEPERCSPSDKHLGSLRGIIDEDTFEFVSEHRVEINHLTSEQLVDLVRGAMREHGVKKIVPSVESAMAEAEKIIRERVRAGFVERFKDQIEAEAENHIASLSRKECLPYIVTHLADYPRASWREAVSEFVGQAREES